MATVDNLISSAVFSTWLIQVIRLYWRLWQSL